MSLGAGARGDGLGLSARVCYGDVLLKRWSGMQSYGAGDKQRQRSTRTCLQTKPSLDTVHRHQVGRQP